MEERQITVDGVTHSLPRPFLVLATQNPIEYEGTFPLPEAQLDRFLIRISLGYPSPEDEVRMIGEQQLAHPLDSLEVVVDIADLLAVQQAVRRVEVSGELRRYILDLIGATRKHPEVYLGASPRGSLALFRTAQTRAAILGREFVLPDDIKVMAVPTLAHRILVGSSARIRDVDARSIVQDILTSVPVPGSKAAR
jgi:MoxR-like ATPase